MSQLLNFDYIPNPDVGRPLFNAQIYIGIPNADPQIESNQKLITATQQDGTEVNLPQPIKTGSGGVPVYNGSPVRIRLAPPYSIKVLDSFGAQKYYFSNIGDTGDSSGASELVLTAEYVSDDTLKVLGDYTGYILQGMQITLKSENTGTYYETSTVVSSSISGSYTEISIADDVVTNNIVSVSVSAYLSDLIVELNKFIENSQQAISDFNDSGNQAISDFNESGNQAIGSFENNQASAIAAAGYNVVGNFDDGATLNQLGDAIYYAGTDPNSGNFSYAGFYAWTGSFPKVVNPGDDPITETGWQLAATGYAKQSGAIQLFGQVIDQNFNIPVGQNALSINAETADGVTVTVPVGSTYMTFGDIQ